MWNPITHMFASTPGWLILAAAIGAGITLGLLGAAAGIRTRRTQLRQAGYSLRWLLVALAVTAAIGVAVVGGVRSFEAVSVRFGSPLVPLTADGMIVACTALRIAALTKGWRIPGALATTYLFIGGTVWLNVAAAHDWSDAVAHALAPISYAILVEMLAHLLRLQLHLATPPRQRIAALVWATSPVVTTRVWLHLARTGTDDPVQARVLVQQLVRLSSRLRMVCHGNRPWRFGQARRARTAALQTVRDGLLPPANSPTSYRLKASGSHRRSCWPGSTKPHSATPHPLPLTRQKRPRRTHLMWPHQKHRTRVHRNRPQRTQQRDRKLTYRQQARRTSGGARVSTAAPLGPGHGDPLARPTAGPMPTWWPSFTAWVARWPSERSSGCSGSAGPEPNSWPTRPDGTTQSALRPTGTRSTANPQRTTPLRPKPTQQTTSERGQPMIHQPENNPDSATTQQGRPRQQGPSESRTQFQPDAQLTPFTRDAHLCITIRRRVFVQTKTLGGGRSC